MTHDMNVKNGANVNESTGLRNELLKNELLRKGNAHRHEKGDSACWAGYFIPLKN